MHVLVSGSTGLVGQALSKRLVTDGHTVRPLVRRTTASDEEVRWDVVNGSIEAEKINGIDAIVHLAGENIAGGRWNDAFKKKILDSRVNGTRLLAEGAR